MTRLAPSAYTLMVPVPRVCRVDHGNLRRLREVSGGGIRVDAQLTRTGVFEYLNPDGTVRREYRPPEEVFKKRSMDSLDCIPVGDDHPDELLELENEHDYRKGLTGEGTRRDSNWLVNSIIVRDPALIEKMKRGKVYVSCGYDCDLEEKPGVTPEGERYDAIQRNITYNHVAIVDVPRAGARARVRMDRSTQMRRNDWNPDQPRAENGQFGEGGSGGEKPSSEKPSGGGKSKESAKDRAVREGQEDIEDIRAIKETTGLGIGTNIDQKSNGDLVLRGVAKGQHSSVEKALAEKGMSVQWNKSKTGGTVVRPHRNRKDSKETDMPNLAKKLARALDELERQKARADAAERRVDAFGDEEEEDDEEEDVEREDADDEEKEIPAFIKKKMKKDSSEVDTLRARVDSLETENRSLRNRLKRAGRSDSVDIQARVKERVALERVAAPFLREDSGEETNLEEMTDRDVRVAVIAAVDRKDCSDAKKFSDDYVKARFDSVVERYDADDSDEDLDTEEHSFERQDAADADEEARAARRMRERSANRWRGDSADKQED